MSDIPSRAQTSARLALLLPLPLTLLLIGCFPVPWVYHQWPDFSGVITRDGKPIGNAKVRYSTDRKAVDCNQAPGEVIAPDEKEAFHYYSEEVTSSADGEFLFRGVGPSFVSGISFLELQNISRIGIFASERPTAGDSRKRFLSVGEVCGLTFQSRRRIL